MEGFKKMQDIGVTTITTYPWMLYGVMNEAPVNEKIDAMHSFASDFLVSSNEVLAYNDSGFRFRGIS